MAKKRANVLSDADVAFLKEAKKFIRQFKFNVPQRTAQDPENRFAPEVYIVKPLDHIPARTTEGPFRESSEGLNPDHDAEYGTAGSGEAYLCAIDAVDDGIDKLDGFTELVYNLTLSTLASTNLYLAVRDKDGKYIITTGGPGDRILVRFYSRREVANSYDDDGYPMGVYSAVEIIGYDPDTGFPVDGTTSYGKVVDINRSNCKVDVAQKFLTYIWPAPVAPGTSGSSESLGTPMSSESSIGDDSSEGTIDDLYLWDSGLPREPENLRVEV